MYEFVYASVCVPVSFCVSRSKNELAAFSWLHGETRTLQFHLLHCTICQLTNPFNIVYLVSLAHHFKGITLSGEYGRLGKQVRRGNVKKKKRVGRRKERII